MSAKQSCRVCGCTEESACTTSSGPCCWVSPGLCSGCAPKQSQQLLSILTTEDLEALKLVPPLQFQVGAGESFLLLAALQLVCRHPDIPDRTREFVTEFALGLQERVGVTENLAALAEAGWHAENDVPIERKDGLILPGDPRFAL